MRRRVGSFIRSFVIGGVALVALTTAGPSSGSAVTSDKNAVGEAAAAAAMTTRARPRLP